MKKYLLWLIPVGVVLYFLSQRKAAAAAAAPPPTAATNTGTATTPKPFWDGWNFKSDVALKNTTANVGKYYGDLSAIGSAIDPGSSGSGSGDPTLATAFNDLWNIGNG